jgi:bacterial/archaeal transporter family-2 protein
MLTSNALWALALHILLAAAAGVATAFQPAINARFAALSGSRLHGGAINFIVGAIAMIAVCLALRAPAPATSTLATGPWWIWTGGLLGAFFVTIALTLAPIMGTANYLAAMIAGQLLGACLIDHFALMGVAAREFTLGRGIGIALILAGVACIRWL